MGAALAKLTQLDGRGFLSVVLTFACSLNRNGRYIFEDLETISVVTNTQNAKMEVWVRWSAIELRKNCLDSALNNGKLSRKFKSFHFYLPHMEYKESIGFMMREMKKKFC
jgi:hypothetical protein